MEYRIDRLTLEIVQRFYERRLPKVIEKPEIIDPVIAGRVGLVMAEEKPNLREKITDLESLEGKLRP
jgi:hypothetical protein